MQVNKKVYACFVDYQKAFDRIKHVKLLEIIEKAGIPDLERKLINTLYWNQYAVQQLSKLQMENHGGYALEEAYAKVVSFHKYYSICILNT